jgi:hypothetical protein
VGRDVQRQRRDIGVEEAIEGAADPVIVEGGELVVRQSEEVEVVPRGPLADAVERLARDQQVAGEHEQGRRGGDAKPPILAGEVVVEELREAEPLEEAIEDRQGADPARVEGASLGAGGLSWPSPLVVCVHPSRSGGSVRARSRERHRASEALRSIRPDGRDSRRHAPGEGGDVK